MKFKVGDKVRLSKSSKYHSLYDLNQLNDYIGIITGIDVYGWYIVDWEINGNTYEDVDLYYATKSLSVLKGSNS